MAVAGVQLLPDTLGLGPEVWRVLSKCHDMRNRTEYEGALTDRQSNFQVCSFNHSARLLLSRND